MKVPCCVCHRYREPDKMDGARCIDRESCFAAASKAAPVRVPKRVLRKHYPEGGGIK